MALTLTGQLSPRVADQRWLYGVSPGNTGERASTGGEMSQNFMCATLMKMAGLRCRFFPTCKAVFACARKPPKGRLRALQ